MGKTKYNNGDYIGVNNILLIKRTTKNKNGQWNALFQCPYCENIFESKIANVVNGHTTSCGCLKSEDLSGRTVPTAALRNGAIQSCGQCHFSKGEQKIADILDSLSVSYVKEYTGFKCYNPRTNRKLRFDFYLKDMNACIEYDGIQHFEDVNWKHETLEDVQYKDDIKNQYCKNNNINLIRIPYWDFDKLNEEYLLSLISNNT